MNNNTPEKLSSAMTRREFIVRTTSSVGLAVAAVATASFFHNRRLIPRIGSVTRVRNFRVPGTESSMAVAKSTDGIAATRAAIAELGGISRFVKPGDKVLIKPNCAFDRPPHLGATTSPEVLGEVVRQCVEAGAKVRVTDNPINNAEGCFAKSGLAAATQNNGAMLWLPTPAMCGPTMIGGVMDVWDAMAEPLKWADKVIGVPTVKTHNLCGVSLCMKNWYGFLNNGRNKLHQIIDTAIADLGAFISPTLVVLDGTRMLIRNGPTGGSPHDVKPGHTVIAGTDHVAMDAYGARMLQMNPKDIEYIIRAERAGTGVSDTSLLKLFKEIQV
jgi:uncharacterized protein (DUF362 family)